ncbi:hypothetical protein [uncultured Aquimarina sp.]|uniref:hypothetical protein n=1 Tax=uncultured Aquimarina sp. TaxID=575652 RepID=UPI002601B630|nr:hypothetical protein [uncultured Aquimarina sp.]
MNSDFKTLLITKKEIREALDKNTFWKNAKNVPFTKSKANWLLQNSRIEENDICGLIGYEDEVMIAFIYFIPDYIKTSAGEKKIYWCRRWWVADAYKNSILATYMMNEAVNAVDKQVLIKYIGKEVEEFYDKQPFTKFSERERFFILFNADANLLISKITVLKYAKPIAKYLERISGWWIQKINRKKISKTVSGLSYEYLSSLDQETWEFLENKCKNDLIPKTKEYVNWQLSNNQYAITPVINRFPYHCLIASASEQLHHINLSVKKEKEIIGFLSFLVRGNEFNVKYFVAKEGYMDECVSALMDNFIKTNTNIIHTENTVLGKKISEKFSNFYSDKRILYAFAHNDIENNFENVSLYDRDGHFA